MESLEGHDWSGWRKWNRLLAIHMVLLLLLGFFGGSPAEAQEVQVQGFISDETSGEALRGANVVLRDSVEDRYGAVTNEQGYYVINDVPPGRYEFRISFVGYSTYRDSLILDESVVRNIQLTPSEERLGEVVIASERGAAHLEAGLQEIEARDLERIPTPGPSGDLAGYLQALPSVVSMGDRGGQLFVRGGTPSQNLVLVDGSLIYQPFHILGFFSAFPEDLVSEVELHAGGFGARYTGRVSSVVDVQMRGGNNQQFEGQASLGPFLTSLQVEGPLKKGELSFLGSTRHSVIEQTAPELIGQELPMKFSDSFGKVQYAGDNYRCSASTMHTYDRGRVDVERERDFRWGNVVIGGRCAGFTPGSEVFSEVNAGITHAFNSIGDEAFRRSSRTWRLNVDAHFTHSLGETALSPSGETTVTWGMHGRRDVMEYDLREKFQGLRSAKSILLNAGAHLGTEITFREEFELNPSVALTWAFEYGGSVEPRFRMAWRPWGEGAPEVNAAAGLYQQTITGISDERDAGSVFTAWVPAPIEGRSVRAIHGLLGAQHQFDRFGFTVEGYYKQLNNLSVPIWSAVARFTTELTLADGKVYGVDTRAEYEHGPFYGYLGYGYMWMLYTTAQESFGQWLGEPIQQYHPPHDRRHQLKAVGGLDFGRLEARTRWQFGSGLPYTQPFGFDSMIFWPGIREHPASDFGTPRVLFEKPYRGRLPPYHRLDVSVEYAISFPFARMTLQVGGINVYNRTNLFYYDVFSLRRVNQLPLTPFFSVNLETH